MEMPDTHPQNDGSLWPPQTPIWSEGAQVGLRLRFERNIALLIVEHQRPEFESEYLQPEALAFKIFIVLACVGSKAVWGFDHPSHWIVFEKGKLLEDMNAHGAMEAFINSGIEPRIWSLHPDGDENILQYYVRLEADQRRAQGKRQFVVRPPQHVNRPDTFGQPYTFWEIAPD